MEIGTVPIIEVIVSINDWMYKKDLAQCRRHSRCSINVSFFMAVKVMTIIRIMMMMIKGGIRSYRDAQGVPLSGEKGRSQLITGGGWVEVSDWNHSWVYSQLLCFINTSLVVFSSSCWGRCLLEQLPAPHSWVCVQTHIQRVLCGREVSTGWEAVTLPYPQGPGGLVRGCST